MLIGVFDSGIGGLTVLRSLRKAWPGHSTIYLGDTARVPYGSKSPQTVTRYAMQVAKYLMDEGVELIVVACNTASATALPELEKSLPIPVVGVIGPGAKAATDASQGGRIGIIGTAATIASGAYEHAIKLLRPDAVIASIACPLFVPLADEGWEGTKVAREVAERYLEPWLPGKEDRPDTVVLGCTHYPILRPAIGDVLGRDIQLIDSAETTARAIAPILLDEPDEKSPTHRVVVTDGAAGFAKTAKRLLGESMPPLEVVDLTPFGS
ncbi:glutamate racemase [bacterium]|nr:glutamate racemase [bacterium]